MNNVHTYSDFNKARNNSDIEKPATLLENENNNNNLNPTSNNPNSISSCLKATFPHFKIKSVCFSLLMINVIAYVFQIVYYKYILTGENWNCTLYNLGAKYTPSIRHDLAIWRLITPIFLHADFWHIFMNNISLFLMGFYIENYLQWNRFKMIFFYILSGIYALFFSSVMDTENLGVGASGAILGMSGFLVVVFAINYDYLTSQEKKFFIFFLLISLSNIFQSSYSGGNKIDNYAHFGGFLTGGMLSIFLIDSSINFAHINYNIIKKMKIIFGILLLIIPIVWIIIISTINVPPNTIKYACKQ